MATIRNRNGRWHVQIRKANARPISRTFTLRKDAEIWARETERHIELEGCVVSKRKMLLDTLSVLISRYVKEEGQYNRSYKVEKYYLNQICNEPFANIPLSQLGPQDIQGWVSLLRKTHKPSSIARRLGLISRVLNIAIKRWGYSINNHAAYVSKPSVTPPRIDRIDKDTLEILYNPEGMFGWMVVLALETGMRRGEIIGVRWADYYPEKRVLQLHITKNGYPRFIPLSPKAAEAIENGDRTQEYIFPMTGNAVYLAWRRLKKKHNIEGLRFHDLRHEAISRMFDEGLTVPEVASISGHRTVSMLFRYAHVSCKPSLWQNE